MTPGDGIMIEQSYYLWRSQTSQSFITMPDAPLNTGSEQCSKIDYRTPIFSAHLYLHSQSSFPSIYLSQHKSTSLPNKRMSTPTTLAIFGSSRPLIISILALVITLALLKREARVWRERLLEREFRTEMLNVISQAISDNEIKENRGKY